MAEEQNLEALEEMLFSLNSQYFQRVNQITERFKEELEKIDNPELDITDQERKIKQNDLADRTRDELEQACQERDELAASLVTSYLGIIL